MKVKIPKDRNEIVFESSVAKKDIPKLRMKPINNPFEKFGFVFLNRRIPIMIPIKIMILT